MPTEAKRETIEDLRAQLDASHTMITSEYRGLKVKEISEIRRALRKQNVSYRVVKNRLMRIAAKDNASAAALSPLLVGPTAIAFGTDESATARAVLDAVRPYARIVKITGGVLGSTAINAESVDQARNPAFPRGAPRRSAGCDHCAAVHDRRTVRRPRARRRRPCPGADRQARRSRGLTLTSRPPAPHGAPHHQETRSPWPS